MSDLIKLLPDHVANQIAAGEVVQRPASVVKELLENAVDAGATKIVLTVKDSGKSLIQVVDNGCGMSAADARASFLRHATSKISSADDLYKLHTMGFRGEALASICAIAHVQLKTRRVGDELGTEINNEGSDVKSQEPVLCPEGTSVSVRNLFYNVPARRNFLSKDLTEYRHILEEFMRVALVHPDVAMNFINNDEDVFLLPIQQRRQRIVSIFGSSFNERLVPIEEETDIVKISGFVTKPEFAKTGRDLQYFFVNNRFFRDRYLGHAISAAYEGLVQSNKFPGYFIYLEVDPSAIDVNVHPTKTEIKFQDNQTIYAFLRSTIRQSLGKFNIAPSLDFARETTFDHIKMDLSRPVVMPEIKVNPKFNPFEATQSTTASGSLTKVDERETSVPNQDLWIEREHVTIASAMNEEIATEMKKPVQLQQKYILKEMRSGFILIDQYRAHVRILFDEFVRSEKAQVATQKLIFPEVLTYDVSDLVWEEVAGMLNTSGFELKIYKGEIEIIGVPQCAGDKNPKTMLNEIVDDYRSSLVDSDLDLQSSLCLAMARSLAIRGGKSLSSVEMSDLIEKLFACQSPHIASDGKKVIVKFELSELTQRFD